MGSTVKAILLSLLMLAVSPHMAQAVPPSVSIAYVTPSNGAVIPRGGVYTTQVVITSTSALNTTTQGHACSDVPVINSADNFDGTIYTRTIIVSCHLPQQTNRTYLLYTSASNAEGASAAATIEIKSGKR